MKPAGATSSANRPTKRRIFHTLLAAALLVSIAVAAAPGAASAQPLPAPKVRGFTLNVPGSTGLQVTPAITNGPSHRARVKVTYTVTVTVTIKVTVKHKGKKKKTTTKRVKKKEKRTKFVIETLNSTQDWVVVASGLEAEVLAVTADGKIGTVATSLLPPGVAPSGQSSVLPTYGSVEVDGYVWVLNYSAAMAPLYAIAPDGHTQEVATLSGALTDMTAGPDNTLEMTNNAGFIDRCAINKQPHASCLALPVPTKFDGGQVDAIGQGGGRVWFTDDVGELASFNPANNSFAGPYGDLSGVVLHGEASALPRTITSAPNGNVFVAAGEGSDPLFENDLIRAINPRTGTRGRSYTTGLTDVVAVTTGSDGNIWFLNETNTSTGAGTVGVLEAASGVMHQYPLPKGYRLPASGVGIDPGPIGSDTLFFTLQSTAAGAAALGEVTGI